MKAPMIIAAACLLTMTACAATTTPVTTPTTPTTPVVTTPTNPIVDTACADFNTLQWMLPIVEELANLPANDQTIITDAQQLISAGCSTTNTTTAAQITAVVVELGTILQSSDLSAVPTASN